MGLKLACDGGVSVLTDSCGLATWRTQGKGRNSPFKQGASDLFCVVGGPAVDRLVKVHMASHEVSQGRFSQLSERMDTIAGMRLSERLELLWRLELASLAVLAGVAR